MTELNKALEDIHDISKYVNTVNYMDCQDFLELLPDNSVDMILIDPPFSGNNATGKEGGRFSTGHILNNDFTERAFYKFIRPCLELLYRKLKMGGHFYCFSDWRQLRNMMDEIELSSYKLLNLVTRDKGYFGTGSGYRRQEEFIIVGSKGPHNNFNLKNVGSVIKVTKVAPSAKSHPHQKPVELLKVLISNSTNEGDVVLDCFAGSGTTGVACKELGRNYILVEKEVQYASIINGRLANVDSQLIKEDSLPFILPTNETDG